MNYSKWLLVGLCALLILIMGCSGDLEKEFQFNYTFEEDQQGWVTDFADLPADFDETFYELDSGWGALPSGLEGNVYT